MDLIQETLLEELEKTAPRRVLCVADSVAAALDTYVRHHDACEVERVDPPAAVAGLASLGRFDLGLLSGALEQLSGADGSALVARLRDVHCRRLCVTWRPGSPAGDPAFWTRERFRSLALTLHRRIDQDGARTEIYVFDIDHYNPRREWNNPDQWAHPENFDRYRW
jgi:hypothetical protein